MPASLRLSRTRPSSKSAGLALASDTGMGAALDDPRREMFNLLSIHEPFLAGTIHLNHEWTRMNTDVQSNSCSQARIRYTHRSVAFRISSPDRFFPLYPCRFVSIRGFLLHGYG